MPRRRAPQREIVRSMGIWRVEEWAGSGRDGQPGQKVQYGAGADGATGGGGTWALSIAFPEAPRGITLHVQHTYSRGAKHA